MVLLNLPLDSDGHVTDTRISKNGFLVKRGTNSEGQEYVKLTATPKDVNFMSVKELAVHFYYSYA